MQITIMQILLHLDLYYFKILLIIHLKLQLHPLQQKIIQSNLNYKQQD